MKLTDSAIEVLIEQAYHPVQYDDKFEAWAAHLPEDAKNLFDLGTVQLVDSRTDVEAEYDSYGGYRWTSFCENFLVFLVKWSDGSEAVYRKRGGDSSFNSDTWDSGDFSKVEAKVKTVIVYG